MRMGAPNEHWVITNLNSQYELCDTYPSLLYVPANATTPVLVGSSKFRSRGRLPVLSYLHGENNATLTRCSQPLSGFSARCVEDEQMLQAILRANPGSNYMYVVDTRPKINAMVNKAQGKGYENESFYSNMKFQFLGIENIHVMRASLQKLIECQHMEADKTKADKCQCKKKQVTTELRHGHCKQLFGTVT
ncbi:myotubularin-related protein [Elysia marginata]|uniref:Myotubularin-related protein n=1 Tax=Elysia marginata TaxID=1093978 RepID=A0AAV4EHM8_9GAST|nr:myotubularin-related protein [Elysia marginata]